jgi:hypothetical protein
MYVCIENYLNPKILNIFMGVKTIYLPDDLCLKLKHEINASGLIASLLFDYYKNKISTTIEELEYEIKEKQNSLLRIKEIKEKEIETILEKKKELEIKEKTEEEKEQIKKEKEQVKRENIKQIIKEELQREPTTKEIEDYMQIIQQENKTNIYQYIQQLKQ